MKPEIQELLIWAITFTIIIVAVLFMFAWILTPTNFSISFNMDNNTLEAIKSINWSAIPK